MSVVRNLQNRFLVCLVFISSCIRMVVAQVLPSDKSDQVATSGGVTSTIKRGSLVRLPISAHSKRQYALEATGVFPYVKVVPLSTGAAPVPIDIAGLAHEAGAAVGNQAASHVLHHKAKSAADDPFCVVFCDSCTGCGGCGSCCSCTGGVDSCACGCSSCSGCGSCCSCTSCTPG